jgi:hypothetical protein
MLGNVRAGAALPMTQPVITSLAIVGTNLVFEASFPADVEQAVLEMRPDLAASWEPVTSLEVPAAGGSVEFSIPKPTIASAFFRLNVTMNAAADAQTNSQTSAELQYMAVPPLGPDGPDAESKGEAVFHFKGQIDGSDRIVITRNGAFWEHVNWNWPPGIVTVNDSKWNPSAKNYLTTTGAVSFLPDKYSLTSASLEVIQGRDVIALERTNDALIVHLDDTPFGASPYEFKICFQPADLKSPVPHKSTVARLKIEAQIDGSDLLKITADEATWFHRNFSSPRMVRLNDIPWNVRRTNVLVNAGTNAFLPAGVDFSTAKIIHRAGRDLATMWADQDAVWINFADNPNGSDAYELEIGFGQ